MPNVTDKQFTTMMGWTQEFFIKNGDYKSVANGSLKLERTIFELPGDSGQ